MSKANSEHHPEESTEESSEEPKNPGPIAQLWEWTVNISLFLALSLGIFALVRATFSNFGYLGVIPLIAALIPASIWIGHWFKKTPHKTEEKEPENIDPKPLIAVATVGDKTLKGEASSFDFLVVLTTIGGCIAYWGFDIPLFTKKYWYYWVMFSILVSAGATCQEESGVFGKISRSLSEAIGKISGLAFGAIRTIFLISCLIALVALSIVFIQSMPINILLGIIILILLFR